MMGKLWVVLFVALAGSQLGQGLPVKSAPPVYPHDAPESSQLEGWAGSTARLYTAVPALALVITAVGLLFGCTWCYRHKDCKPNEGADNQLFTASATQLHDGRRSQPPDSGFSEPANNNISEDNNNGPISLREMQNIANNNAAAYIISENEERNTVSRESVVEFEPLPSGIRVVDPLEHCADWFGDDDFPRSRLQYLREIGRGWFGRVVEGEIEEASGTTTVAVKILNQNASLEDKARFLNEARMYRDVTHENILQFVSKCLQEDPWILIFDLCSMDLQQYLSVNRPKMAILNESGVPLQLMSDVASGLAHLHSRGYLFGHPSITNVLVRVGERPRGVLGNYVTSQPDHEFTAPETRRHPPLHTASSEVWSLGTLVWEVCAWGAPVPPQHPPPPDLPCPYRNHLYQVMQLCWNPNPEERPTAAQVQALLNHLHTTQRTEVPPDGHGSDFEDRWQRLKPNTIPKVDEHVAIVHAPSTSIASNFTGSDRDLDRTPTTHDTLSVDMDTAVSRSSSIMSDKDPLSIQIKSESLTNLHGSLEDVRNIYLTHNELAALECHQGNISLEERELDRSDSSVDPWLKDIIAGSQDDVSYYRDVSDVIKNLDNILNSEKTSSSESSHQASPSRDNLSLDCKKDYPVQSSLVKSPGITNFRNILEIGFDAKENEPNACEEEEVDRDTIGTLSHSFERHSDSTSQHTLENLTPDTPIKDIDEVFKVESQNEGNHDIIVDKIAEESSNTELPKENVECSVKLPNLKDVHVESIRSVSEIEQSFVREDCETSCDNNLAEIVRTDKEKVETKSLDTIQNVEEISAPVVELNEEKIKQTSVSFKSENIAEHVDEIRHSGDSILPETVRRIAEDIVNNDIILTAVEVVTRKLRESQEKSDQENATFLLASIEEDTLNNVTSKTIQINDLTTSQNFKDDPIKNIDNEIRFEVEATIADPAITNTTKEDHRFRDKANDTKPADFSHMPDLVQIVATIDQQSLNTDNVEHVVYDKTVVGYNEQLPKNDFDQEVNQIAIHTETPEHTVFEESAAIPTLPSEPVQNRNIEEFMFDKYEVNDEEVNKENANQSLGVEIVAEANMQRSDTIIEQGESDDSTVYMDLIKNTNSEIKENNSVKVTDIQSCLDLSKNENQHSLNNNESTVYLDLPSLLKEADEFLHSERIISSQDLQKRFSSSTPNTSDESANKTEPIVEYEAEQEARSADNFEQAEIKEQKCVTETLSPFESPTKSHPTDTFDENSSVVLGPFENGVEYKSRKSIESVDFPKEELLAFSSNFSEINLETPSPLRDGNFLNEVPDIIMQEDLQFDDITISEVQPEKESQTENTDETDQSGTTKHISPSTPPNSPGFFLASTSQQKYLVDIDLEVPETNQSFQSYPPIDSDSGLSSLQKEIDLNQIELQITSKLAMAENENNLNIEYSGPLTVEGVVSEEGSELHDSDAVPETFLAGNGGSIDVREEYTLDEACVNALRNELELKLPLAQVANIEPANEEPWSELPPPPELVLQYGGSALSPIAEETRHQLSAYENDAWNASARTDSSESYPEPCNNSTDEVTELATAGHDHSTYTIHSNNATYTLHKDDKTSSREVTMSADSLNSPYRKRQNDQTSVDDKTFVKEDEKESNCERISQVSPFLTSPVTDTSAPVDSENVDNATGVSTLSKTTVPTDAKLSKPTECLSKATSIDSWCSNDTLYNVEENFDDLAMDSDVPLDFPQENDDKSESTDTLTHNDDEKELSHCSTYIVHDSKSELDESFSPDSVTANGNCTYTKAKTEATGATEIKSIDSAKNTQTKDLAYGTLPSCSNCTSELLSGIEDPWRFHQPELVRKSPIWDEVTVTPPKSSNNEKFEDITPKIENEPEIKKMDSVDISCLSEDLADEHKSSEDQMLVEIQDSPPLNCYKEMVPSLTSTPLLEQVVEESEIKPIKFELQPDSPDLQAFLNSAEARPQDILEPINPDEHFNPDNMLDSETKNSSNSVQGNSRTPTYTDFEDSATFKQQEVYSRPAVLGGEICPGDFTNFKNSAMNRPQDLSSSIDASSMFLRSERQLSGIMANQSSIHPTPSGSQMHNELINLDSNRNTEESHETINFNRSVDHFITDLDDEETDQPHSIIIPEALISTTSAFVSEPAVSIVIDAETGVSNELINSLNKTYNSHPAESFNNTFNSHENELKVDVTNEIVTLNHVNGIDSDHVEESPRIDVADLIEISETNPQINLSVQNLDLPNGEDSEQSDDKQQIVDGFICNGETKSEKFATVNFINESFEELENNDNSKVASKNEITSDKKDKTSEVTESPMKNESISNEVLDSPIQEQAILSETLRSPVQDKNFFREFSSEQNEKEEKEEVEMNGTVDKKIMTVTEDFLHHEKEFSGAESNLQLLSDIRFTGPATEIISTSFNQDSPTEPTSPDCEQDNKPDSVTDLVKEWDSDSESQSSNSSSGEFIWKDGAGHETAVATNTHFDHQRTQDSEPRAEGGRDGSGSEGCAGSGDSGSGSEGDEVEFVPSSWDCRAAPAKSSLRSLEAQPDSKKRVVFKRQKYHCVYEYPREAPDADLPSHSPATIVPDLSTYCEWDPSSVEDAELGYGQLFGSSNPLDMYPLRSGIAFGSDYDEDFFISSSARPFESLGIMSTASQFFPGMHVKSSLLDHEHDMTEHVADDLPPPPSPLPAHPPPPALKHTPSLDFTTPDSGVEDITPVSTTTDEDFKTKKLPESEVSPCWKPVDSASSSESVSPSSPGGESLGGLRHTRDKLKLDLPPSPHIPSPRHNRVFNFVLDKPKRHRIPDERPVEIGSTPLVMTDETPVISTTLAIAKDCEDVPVPEPTFSTFGKCGQKNSDAEQKIVLTDEVQAELNSDVKEESPVKGEGTVLDSGDEDSGIESSSKATLERNKTPNVS